MSPTTRPSRHLAVVPDPPAPAQPAARRFWIMVCPATAEVAAVVRADPRAPASALMPCPWGCRERHPLGEVPESVWLDRTRAQRAAQPGYA